MALVSTPAAGASSPATRDTSDDVKRGDRDQLDSRSQKADVLIIGKGMISHWASVWVFERGEVFSVELTAISKNGCRWWKSRRRMRFLRKNIPNTSSSWSTSCQQEPDSSDTEQNESTLSDQEELQPFREEIAKCIGWASDDVQTRICRFFKECGSDHYIMSGSEKVIHVENTSPQDLFDHATAVPLNGAFYDLVFHNCQLFIVQLLCDEYSVPAEKLPLAVGSIAAGPVLLILEVSFIFAYGWLLQREPWAAVGFGLLWIAAEVFLTSRYGELADNLGMNVGIWGSFAIAIIIGLLSPSAEYLGGLEPAIPMISLLWDSCMVLEAWKVNKVSDTDSLLVLNVLFVLAACIVSVFLQWWFGWPVNDLLVVLLVLAFMRLRTPDPEAVPPKIPKQFRRTCCWSIARPVFNGAFVCFQNGGMWCCFTLLLFRTVPTLFSRE